MEGYRIKPDLSMYFAQMPVIGMWIEFDYNEAKTLDDMIKLFHKWMNIASETSNAVKKTCYEAVANYVYSWLTGKSYDSNTISEFTITKIKPRID